VTGIHYATRPWYPDVMSTPSPEPRRFSIRLPHWGWCLLATIFLVIGFVGLSVWLPWYREQVLIQEVEKQGGSIETEIDAPEWLLKLIGERLITNLRVFERVVVVDLEDTAISDFGMSNLTGCRNVPVLMLTRTKVTDAGLVHLSRWKDLWNLSLAGTAVSDAGMTQVSRLANLHVLALSETSVSDSGLAHLVNLTALEYLDLSETAVTDAGAARLSRMTNLKSLHLDGTAVTEKGFAELKAALPGCYFFLH
jgi:hypothetical protein